MPLSLTVPSSWEQNIPLRSIDQKMIIDSHVHFPFSLPLPEEEWGAFLVERAERSGINALIVSDVFIRGSKDAGSYPTSAACRRANAYAADQARRNPGRLYFLAYLNHSVNLLLYSLRRRYWGCPWVRHLMYQLCR